MDSYDQDSLYQLLVHSITDYAIYMLDLEGMVISWNAGAEKAKGYRSDEIVGQHFSVFYTDSDRLSGQPQVALDAALQNGRFEGEGWRLRKDGSRFWAFVVIHPIQNTSGSMIGFAKITRDMSEQKKRESQANEQERNFRLLVQGVTDYAIYMLSPQGTVTNWNAGAERAKGYRAEEIVGHHFSEFYLPKDREAGLPEMALARALREGKFEGEGWRLRKDGSRFWAHVVIDPIRDDQGDLIGFAKITRDVTEKKRIQDQVYHLAHHDSLTTLLNRESFRNEVEETLIRGRRSALLYLDLDRFKPINDTLGHPIGDKVLQIVAKRILRQLRKPDIGGRLGGDEFAVLLVDCTTETDVAAACERLIREISRPMVIDAFSVSVGVSVGIVLADGDQTEPEMLFRNADLALYAAKNEERGTYRWYQQSMESVALHRKELEADLRLALTRGEFCLHYQPIVRTDHDAVIGYEALIRWESPTRGKVPPADFIPFAEENGLMLEIGEWVMQAACAEAAQWAEDLSISINLSPVQFRSPNLAQKIAEVLETTGLASERLEVEITETAMMGDIAAAKLILDQLRAMGIKIALDDFGTGYSSLSFLRQLPFTRIKIDKSFIQDLGKTQESLAIVRAVTGLCSSLGVATTAEGVETDDQLRILRHEGCNELQGYLFGRPTQVPERDGTVINRLSTVAMG